MLVRGDVMRGRYRHSFSRPEPFRPGRVEEVRFTMPDAVHTFRAGHRIVVQVQSSWFPLAERSPQQFVNPWTCRPEEFLPCEVTLLHERGAPRRLRSVSRTINARGREERGSVPDIFKTGDFIY